MNQKKVYFYTTLLAIAFMSFIFISKKETPTRTTVAPIPPERTLVTLATDDEPQMMTEKPEASDISITKDEFKAIHEALPGKRTVKEEFNKNPHAPSKSLMSFAKKLGPVMEKAFKNEANANALVNELSACANNVAVADAARALCVQDAERLSGYHPHLKDKTSDLRAGMSPEVKKILDTNDATRRKN